MAWSNSREDELRRELRDVRRELEDLKRGLARKHAVQAREIEALRIKSDTAFDRVFRTFKRYAVEQKAGLDRKWDGQPHDELGRFDFGKQPKPELVSQPAAMRPRGPRPLGTPAQQARLAIAKARAEDAVARVQQLDPTWRPPQSLTSRDNRDDVEVMIRAREAEIRESEARYIALSRMGTDDSYPWRDAPRTAEFVRPRGEVVGTRMPNVRDETRTVPPGQFEEIRIGLLGGARRIEADARYEGVWYKRQDGSIFGLRLSAEHGLTIDIIEGNDPVIPRGLRIHQR